MTEHSPPTRSNRARLAPGLAAVWKAWAVGSERELGHPDLVEHTGIVYGITGSGQRLAVYAANFAPKDVAHDAPILAAQ